MNRTKLNASLVASLLVVAGLAQANEGDAVESTSSVGVIMEDAHPAGGRATLEAPRGIESVFPGQGPDDDK